MARRMTQGRKEGGKDVRISVTLPEDAWQRLRCMATMRRTTATAIVADLVVKAVERVRLPTVGDADEAEHAA